MARNAQHSVLQHGGASSPATYVELEEVTSITGPDGSANLINASHLQSNKKEYLQGLADGGTIQLECNYVGGTKQLALFEMFNTGADPEFFRMRLPNNSALTTYDDFYFLGIVTKWSLGAKVDDKQTLTMTIQTTGDIVLDDGAAA